MQITFTKTVRRLWITLSMGSLAYLGLASFSLGADITVDASGGGDVKTIQAALDAIPKKNPQKQRILIKPGKYEELIKVPKEKSPLTIVGLGTKPEETVLSYHLKASDPKPDGSGNVGTTGSTSWLINSPDLTVENVTFENSAGDNVGQAVALKTNTDRLIFRNCRFIGYQDTLYPSGNGRVYFKDCYITGDTDFIFGNAMAVFDHCTINSSDAGYVTAANTPPGQKYGFVFLDCTLAAPESVKAGTVWLGRPWQWDRGTSAAVAYIRTKMGPQINPKGWHPWDEKKNTEPEKVTRYSEFGSMDADGKALDVSQRVNWSHQLSAEEAAEYTPAKVLGGEDHWDPTADKSAPPATQPAQ